MHAVVLVVVPEKSFNTLTQTTAIDVKFASMHRRVVYIFLLEKRCRFRQT